jgi:hypothetical protein
MSWRYMAKWRYSYIIIYSLWCRRAVSFTTWPIYPKKKTLPPPVPHRRKLGAPQNRSASCKKKSLVPAGNRSSAFQPVGTSLYQLSYPGSKQPPDTVIFLLFLNFNRRRIRVIYFMSWFNTTDDSGIRLIRRVPYTRIQTYKKISTCGSLPWKPPTCCEHW